MPRQFYNDRYLSPRPFFVESEHGEPLAAIQYLPWADGAAILLHGKLPLEGLWSFSGPKIAGRGRVIRLKEGQISYVLPVTQAEFGEWLERIQRQSNMRVKQDPGRFVVQKLADEGANSPYMARIFIGVLHLRDQVYADPTKRDSFDTPYDYVTSALSSARDSARKLGRLWNAHGEKVASGEIAKIDGGNIHVQESIDRHLRSEIETFLNAATRCLKTGMQNIASELGMNIGFLFQKQGSFENGIAALRRTDPDLAPYLQQTRTWSEPMLKSRIDLEHGTWVLPRTGYAAENGAVRQLSRRWTESPYRRSWTSRLIGFAASWRNCRRIVCAAKCPTGSRLPKSRLLTGCRKCRSGFGLRWRTGAARPAHRFSPVTVRRCVIANRSKI